MKRNPEIFQFVESGIRKKKLLVKSGILGFGIQNTVQENPESY